MPKSQQQSGAPTGGSGGEMVLPFILLSLAAMTIGAVALLTPESLDSEPGGAGDHAVPPVPAPDKPPTPAPTPTATVTKSKPPDRDTQTQPSKKPTATRTVSKPPAHTAPSVLGDTFTSVVNAASGLCLDVESPEFDKLPEVITAGCNGSASQEWRLDENGLVHLRADPDFCLDSQGNTDANVRIWPCNPVAGDQPQNLVFTADPSGTIRPSIAPDLTTTPQNPAPGSKVGFRPVEQDDGQRWTAGQAPKD